MWKRRNHLVHLILVFAVSALVASSVMAQETPTGDPKAPIKNLQFQSADIRSVLTFLADYGGVNVVVAPKVSGTVTIKLSNVGWRQALEIIGSTYDMAIVEEAQKGYFRVLPVEDYRNEVTEQRKHMQSQLQLEPLRTKIVHISNSTSNDMIKAVKSLLTERGKASSDPRSNSVILQEVPSNFDAVLSFIAELDRPAKQIKISAQLVEISTTNLTEIGVNWRVDGSFRTNSGRTISQTGSVTADLGATAPVGQYSISALQNGWTVNAVVEALVTSGNGKIVAHPEITTIENKMARVQVGQKVPIKQFDESGNTAIVFEEVGTILLVTPHITAENQILMHLRPERSTFEFDPNGIVISTNNAETNVIVGNGETAVIAGLTTQDEVESVVGVPVLKDIPILGNLFKFTQKRVQSRDLVIFVTPTIVETGIAMSDRL